MDENLAARILRLPAPILGELSVVPGPGWYLRGRVVEGAPYAPWLRLKVPRLLLVGDAWWSANPVGSVAAVLGCSMFVALGRLRHEVGYWKDDVHAAALAIIEQRVAAAVPGPARQSVVNLGAVGEVFNLQGPVTLSIGADGVKVTR